HAGEGPDADELVDGYQPADDGPVLDGHVACHLDGVRDDDVVTDDAVVRHVHVRHQEAALPDRRLARRRRAAIDRAILANDGAVADLDPGLLALVLQVLGVVPDHTAVADLHAGAESGVALQHRVRRDSAPLSDRHLGPDDRVRPHRYILGDVGRLIDERGTVDHLSTTIAIISASATTCPSTYPTPFILQVFPRNDSISSSNRIWSPGTTGRRHFTLSRDMKYITLSSTFWPSKWLIRSIPPTWAIASMISIPGMIGCPGKCP